MKNSILEIAHRGYSQNYKDNTILSFKEAINNNFDIIELDIQITKDDDIIIFHDTYIEDKINNSHLFIFELTTKEIKKIDPDIPTLNEFFSNIDTSKHNIYLDIKGSKKIVPYLLSFLNDYETSKIYIGSFNILMIDQMNMLNPKLNYGIISETMFTSDLIDIMVKKYNLKFFCFHWSVLQHNEINYLKQKNILVFTYTNKLEIILDRMIQFNVDGIVTNCKIKS